jgi:hypothetical protein
VNNGYEYYDAKIGKNGPTKYYLVKVRGNESAEHAFLCWLAYTLITKRGIKAKMDVGGGPDIELAHNNRKICIEIETGKRKEYIDKDEMDLRYTKKRTEYDAVYLLVSNERVARKFSTVCDKIITRAKLEDAIDSLFPNTL